jgi:hypothetical protein
MRCLAAALAVTAGVLACGGGGGDSDAGPDLHVVIGADVGYDAPKDPAATDAPKEWDLPDFAWPEADDAPAADPASDPVVAPDEAPDPFVTPDPVVPETCAPSCAGKACGSNGCGGSCGSCGAGKECIDFQCKCLPSCGGKSCGDDGCGGSCGACPDGCTPPPPAGSGGASEYKCMVWGDCTQAGAITCADEPRSSDVGMPNNSDKVDLYACRPGKAVNGPEKAYRFDADGDGEVAFTLEPGKDYLDVYVLEGTSCNGHACKVWGHGKVLWPVVKGKTYWVVVDASVNNSGSFTLSIDCPW